MNIANEGECCWPLSFINSPSEHKENVLQSKLGSRPVFKNVENQPEKLSKRGAFETLIKDNEHPNRRRRKLSPELLVSDLPKNLCNNIPSSMVDSAWSESCEKAKENIQLNLLKSNESTFPLHQFTTASSLTSISCVSSTTIPVDFSMCQTTPVNSCEPKPERLRSVVAFDVVRAAFTKNICLEDFLSECRCADFSFAAIDRSPIARMMEGTDYVIGIMAYEQSRESKKCFQLSDFISSGRQPFITTDMITTLADWMVEVQENFSFNHETIHLAWGLLYAYLDQSPSVPRRQIQLMACAAIMVACKHEERQMPRMSEFLYITDNAYAKEEFLEAERCLLVAIDFSVHRPNPYVFLRRYARVLDAHNGMVQFMSRFLLETGMHCHQINLHRESKKAAAVLWLARRVLGNPSYADWMRRPEISRLRSLAENDTRFGNYYRSCNANNSTGLRIRDDAVKCVDLQKKHHFVRSHSDNPSELSKKLQLPDSMSTHFQLGKKSTSQAALANHSENDAINHDSLEDFVRDTSSDCAKYSELFSHLCRLQTIDNQRRPLWPPILQHITGYDEAELIPLSLIYHKIALRLLAEVARGGSLDISRQPSPSPTSITTSESPSENVSSVDSADTPTVILEDIDCNPNLSCSSDTRVFQKLQQHSDVQTQRCISPGGHHLRRQAVTKYCAPSFLGVADAYPQLSFENLIPYFSEIQCVDDCACFICANLVTNVNRT